MGSARRYLLGTQKHQEFWWQSRQHHHLWGVSRSRQRQLPGAAQFMHLLYLHAYVLHLSICVFLWLQSEHVLSNIFSNFCCVSHPAQILSPKNKGLIRRAISQSGVALCPWAVNRNPRQYAAEVSFTFMNVPHCQVQKQTLRTVLAFDIKWLQNHMGFVYSHSQPFAKYFSVHLLVLT